MLTIAYFSVATSSLPLFLEENDKAIHEMKQHFNLEDQGDIKDYLGVNVKQTANGDIKLTQPHLIKQIVNKLKLPLQSAGHSTPANPTKVLQ
jgi:hypothetical protein